MPIKHIDDICRKCGECCREKVRLDSGEVIYLDMWCAGIDPKTRLCRIYEHREAILRDALGQTCLNIKQAIETNDVPDHCAYRRLFQSPPSRKVTHFDPAKLDRIPRIAYLQMRMANIQNRRILNIWLRKQGKPQFWLPTHGKPQ